MNIGVNVDHWVSEVSNDAVIIYTFTGSEVIPWGFASRKLESVSLV